MQSELYAVIPDATIIHALRGNARPHTLRLGVESSGAVFLIPIPEGADKNSAKRRQKLLLATNAAVEDWVRVEWDPVGGGYLHFKAEGDLGDPVWPPENVIPDIDAAVDMAFSEENVITSMDHDAVKRARGLQRAQARLE